MKKTLYAGLILLPALFGSCKNDLDIVAPGEELIVVYSLLNTGDSIQYIKINKGFASQDQSPLVLSQDPDALFFDSLNVELIDLDMGVSANITKENFYKEPGDFTNAVNYIYTTRLGMTRGHHYRLKVTDPLSGNTASSELELVGDPDAGIPNDATINAYGIEHNKPFLVNFDGDKLARSYEIRVKLIYEEMNSSTGTNTVDTAVWIFSRGKFNEQRKILIRTEGQTFYDVMAQVIPQKGAEVTRRGLFLEFEYWTADDEFTTYLDVYGSSSIGVVQKRTDYTNINGGFGLFAGRNRFTVTGTQLDPRIKNELKTNPVMAPLRFVD